MKNKKIILVLAFLVFSLNFILAGCEEGQIDINTASLEDLDLIYGVGTTTAQLIIDARPFETLDDLVKVSGIAEKTLNKIKEQGLACVAESASETETSEETQADEEEDEEKDDSEKETLYIVQEKTDEEKNEKKVLDAITLNSEKNSERIPKNNYFLYGLIVFAILIMILLIFRKNKYKNEFK